MSCPCAGERVIDLDKCYDLCGAAADHDDKTLALTARVQALTAIDIAQSLRIVCDRLTSIEMSLDRLAQPMFEDGSETCYYRVATRNLESI